MKFRDDPVLAQLLSRSTSALLGVVGAAVLASACAASSPVAPQNDPYFPATLAVSPDPADSFLFIANANSDLKYGSGSVQVYDLAQVGQMTSAWSGGAGALPADCTADAIRPELAHCSSTTPDGARAGYVAAAAVQIGNFVSALRVQLMNGGTMRLFSTVRGDPSVTWMDFSPSAGTLDCGGSGSFPRCDDRHRLQTIRNDESLGVLLQEPFGMAIDGPREHVIVTHLTLDGGVTLVRAPLDPAQPPTLQDHVTGIWAPNNSTNAVSAVAASVRKPGDPTDLFYVTSRAEARINVLHAVDTVDAAGVTTGRLVRADSFFYAPEPAGNGTGGDARGVSFSPDGDQAYVVSRTPSSLMIFDTSIDPASGTPRHLLRSQVALCPHLTAGLGGGPDALAVIDINDDPAIYEPRVYVTCFDIGQIWVIDTNRGVLEGTIPVGRGPDSIVISPVHKQAYVGNYGDDTISVIDLDTQSPTYQHAVLQLGELRGEN